MRKGLLVVAALGLCLAALGIGRRGGESRARRLAADAGAAYVSEHVAAYRRALADAATRLAQLEARPPEVLERTLAALAEANPEIQSLYACDAAGRVLAAWSRAAVAPAAPALKEDPAAGRRAALAAGGEWVRVTGAAGAGERLELGVLVPVEPGAPALYLAADVSMSAMAARLAELERSAAVRLALVADDGAVVFPRSDEAIDGDLVAVAPPGLTLRVGFPGDGAATAQIAAGFLLLVAAAATAAAAALRHRRRASPRQA